MGATTPIDPLDLACHNIVMEPSSYNMEQVYVLRHSFRPNIPFEEDLSQLVKEGHTKPLSFSVYGSDERWVEPYDLTSRDFLTQKDIADSDLRKMGSVTIEPVLARNPNEKFSQAVRSPAGKPLLQIAMKPRNMHEYNGLIGELDKIRMGTRGQAVGLQATRVYLTIPFDQLRSQEEVRQGLGTIREKLADSANHLYQLTANTQLSGGLAFRPVAPNPYGGNFYHPDSRVS